MTIFLGLFFLFQTSVFALFTPQAVQVSSSNLAERMQAKLEHIKSNGARQHPDSKPTVLTENEVNAYMTSGRATLPKGVQRVQFQGTPGVITTVARVDFDRLTEGRRSANPLLVLFTGIHDVTAVAHANGAGGTARVQVDTVALDGVQVPRMALEFFINHYLKPKYPQAGLDMRFTLPDRIDQAVIGEHELVIVQK